MNQPENARKDAAVVELAYSGTDENQRACQQSDRAICFLTSVQAAYDKRCEFVLSLVVSKRTGTHLQRDERCLYISVWLVRLRSPM